MRLPGFTAERALRRRAEVYQEAAIAADPAGSGLIVPQGHICPCLKCTRLAGCYWTWCYCGVPAD
jgi:hypothetical protein